MCFSRHDKRLIELPLFHFQCVTVCFNMLRESHSYFSFLGQVGWGRGGVLSMCFSRHAKGLIQLHCVTNTKSVTVCVCLYPTANIHNTADYVSSDPPDC